MSHDETVVQYVKIILGVFALVAFLGISHKVIELLSIIASKP